MKSVFGLGGDLSEYRSLPYLRFGLSDCADADAGAESDIGRFWRALTKAHTIAAEVFAPSTEVEAYIATISEHQDGSADRLADFTILGFPLHKFQYLGSQRHVEKVTMRPEEYWHWDHLRFDSDLEIRDWARLSIAKDMAIQPSTDALIFLIDPSREIGIHIYDDRGMDVFAINTEELRRVFAMFHDWILDFDRPRIAKLLE